MGFARRSVLVLFTILLCMQPGSAGRPPLGGLPSGGIGQELDVDLQGNLYIVHRDRNVVELLDRDRQQVREIGGFGWGNDQFDQPGGIWARNGIDVFVADYGNHRIQRFDGKLNYISTLSTREGSNPDERFGYPSDVAVSRFADLYVCDTENSRILKFNAQQVVAGAIGGIDAGKGRLSHPTRVAIGPEDMLYVLDASRIVVFDAFGNFTGVLGEGLLHEPRMLYADGGGVIVVDHSTLFCFDAHQRAVCSIPLGQLLGENGDRSIAALAVSRGRLYLLTDTGLVTVPDPRRPVQPDMLDKDKKSQ